jgi:hypothetical protein
MAVKSMEMVDEAMALMEIARGTSPSLQGVGTETSVPRNLSSTAAALRNCSGKNADCFRVFLRKAFYRWRGNVIGGTRWPHHGFYR